MSPTAAKLRAQVIGALAGITTGVAIAWLDNRPGWDDTGISAGLVVCGAALFAALGTSIVTVSLALSVPLIAMALARGNTGALLALPFAIVGAVIGHFVHRALRPGGGAKAPTA